MHRVSSVLCSFLLEFQHDNLGSEGSERTWLDCFIRNYTVVSYISGPINLGQGSLVSLSGYTDSFLDLSIFGPQSLGPLARKEGRYLSRDPDALATEGNEKGREYVHRPGWLVSRSLSKNHWQPFLKASSSELLFRARMEVAFWVGSGGFGGT